MTEEYSDYTQAELEAIFADRDYWLELGKAVHWTLHGWTYRRGATFFDKYDRSIEITGDQRDDILAAINGKKTTGA